MGGSAKDEIPLLSMLFYLFHYVGVTPQKWGVVLASIPGLALGDLRGRQRQVGSLAGAAHLLNDNTGVLRLAQ